MLSRVFRRSWSVVSDSGDERGVVRDPAVEDLDRLDEGLRLDGDALVNDNLRGEKIEMVDPR